ncbi:MAG: hypothetical protein SFU83_22310 [Meiothermus sp.]|nr:hypothetical protein [Meiothermus sp.]
MEKGMTIALLLVIIVVALIAFGYAFINSFAAELQQILTPVTAAAILALLLGIKSAYIDRPAPVLLDQGNIVVIKDNNRPLHLGLGGSPNYSAGVFRKGITDFISSDGLWTMPGLERSEASESILDSLEHKIVDWIGELHKIEESWLNEEFVSGFPNGAISEEATPLTTKKMISRVTINESSFPNNKLFSVQPVDVLGPTGLKVYRKQIQPTSGKGKELKRLIIIETTHSIIRVQIWMTGHDGMPASLESLIENKKLDRKTLDNVVPAYAYYLAYQIKQEIKWAVRYSTEGKLHPRWGESLGKKFRLSFAYPE